jgi:hypothetical protein
MTAAEWVYLLATVGVLLVASGWLLWLITAPQYGCSGDCDNCAGKADKGNDNG